MSYRCLIARLGMLVFAALLPPIHSAAAESAQRAEPRLVVLIVVDQLRGDLVTRFDRYFGPGGFRRLAEEGALFANAHYSYGASETAPGHATIGTGRLPRQHGIVANQWYLDDSANTSPQAVFDGESHRVPEGAAGPAPGASPHNMIGPGLGDQLRISDRRSRVYSVALKDRAAIFPAGLRPNGAFWLDGMTGQFISSSYYCSDLPAVVEQFNSGKPAERWSGGVWDWAIDAKSYEGCYPVEAAWSGYLGLGANFPHRLPAVENGRMRPYIAALACSPYGNELVVELAEQIVKEEKLGRGEAVDMLCVGFSSNDYVGHYFGIDSPEAMDITIQTDRQLAHLLATLDEQVGLAHCVIALTGDHGATTTPMLSRKLGLGGGILDLPEVERVLNGELQSFFPKPAQGEPPYRIVLGADVPWVYLSSRLLATLPDAKRREVLRRAAQVLKGFDGVTDVVTSDDLEGPPPSLEEGARYLAWRCYSPGRSGQLYIQLGPYWFKTDDKIAGHDIGTTHDRHVPIFVYGAGVRPGRYFTAADPCDIAVTLAALIGIEPPLNAAGRVLSEAIETERK